MRLVVTGPLAPSPADEQAELAAAARHRLRRVPRAGRSLAAVAAAADAGAVLVVGVARVALWIDGVERPWNAGMGELRLRRLLAGERATRDGFLEAAALRAGDAVLDATLGLGMDALVAAGAVGEAGRVLGVEASPALAAFTAEGLARHPSAAARRVEVVQGSAAELLHRLPARSFDVIVFDPMFRHPRAGGDAFALVRALGEPAPLTPATLERARRVARRWVVVKDATPGWDLVRLGLAPLPGTRAARRLYARLDAR